jgi:hypothetical protein
MSLVCSQVDYLKHFNWFPSVFGGHLMVVNISPSEEEEGHEGYHTYSLRVGGGLCVLI